MVLVVVGKADHQQKSAGLGVIKAELGNFERISSGLQKGSEGSLEV